MADSSPAGLKVAVDIGGTFTDLVAFDESDGRLIQSKSLTTPHELSQGVWDCLAKAGITPKDADNVVHGSTIAINIAIEEKGARTALVVTKGTRDVYKIGRQSRPEAYNFSFKRPVPLALRRDTYEVDERMDAWGEVLVPLDVHNAEAVARAIKESGAESVAVCFLHSYKDPRHEVEMGEILRKRRQSKVIRHLRSETYRRRDTCRRLRARLPNKQRRISPRRQVTSTGKEARYTKLSSLR